MNYSYIKKSLIDDGSQQLKVLAQFKIDKSFVEDGFIDEGSMLDIMISELQYGDYIYISDFQKIAKSSQDLLNVIYKIEEKNACLISINDEYESNASEGKAFLKSLDTIVRFEKASISERQKEGIEIAKKKGIYKGRQPSFVDKDKFDKLYNDYINRKITKVEFSKQIGVTRPTLDKIVKAYELSEISITEGKYYVDNKAT